jgi:hypothetical protein
MKFKQEFYAQIFTTMCTLFLMGREPRNMEKMRLAFPKEELIHNIFVKRLYQRRAFCTHIYIIAQRNKVKVYYCDVVEP